MVRIALVATVFAVAGCSIGSSTTASSDPNPPDRDDTSAKTTDSAPLPDSTGSAAATRPLADALPDSAPGEWTWFGDDQFEGKPTCMDGSKTGLGVSKSPSGSNKVLIYMQGGGACFDLQTCALSDTLLASTHANEDDFDKWKTAGGAAAVLNRTDASNPFKDWNYVFVPYCSGDVFAGNAPTGDKTYVGFENVASYLPRLQSTFHGADQLVLSGSSAGGYGAFYNYVQVQKTFDWLDISMIDDSGPPLSPSFTNPCLAEQWKDTWNMESTSPVAGPFPLGFDDATGKPAAGLLSLMTSIVTAHPKSKFAFLSHEGDLVMRYFHGIGDSLGCRLPGLMDDTKFAAGLQEIATSLTLPNFTTFYAAGTEHMFLSSDDHFAAANASGQSLAAYLTSFIAAK